MGSTSRLGHSLDLATPGEPQRAGRDHRGAAALLPASGPPESFERKQAAMTEPHEHDLPEPDDTPLAPDEHEEAEQEEAEQPEPEPDDDDAPDAEPEPEPVAQTVTPEQHDARMRKIEQSFETYMRRVATLLEDDATDYLPCPLCLEAPRGFVHRAEAGRVPDEQADLVKQFLGLARPVDYPPSSQHSTCRECDGLGKVTTGSRVPGQETATCTACLGRGFTGPAPSAPVAASNGNEGMTGPLVYSEPTAPADKDEWDQPRLLPDGRDNPNFGRMPNHWIQVEPWGDTRGLTAQDAVGRS